MHSFALFDLKVYLNHVFFLLHCHCISHTLHLFIFNLFVFVVLQPIIDSLEQITLNNLIRTLDLHLLLSNLYARNTFKIIQTVSYDSKKKAYHNITDKQIWAVFS